MEDQANDLERRVEQLDQTVDRLTCEVASLRLELTALAGALKDHQLQPLPDRARAAGSTGDKPLRPTAAPAAVVLLLAIGLLSWQLLSTSKTARGVMSEAPDVPAAAPIEVPVQIPTVDPPSFPIDRPTVYKGTLSVNADRPGARVFVNRKSVGTAPVRVRNLRAGAHLVWVERDGFRRWTKVVTVPAETITRVSADLEPVPVLHP